LVWYLHILAILRSTSVVRLPRILNVFRMLRIMLVFYNDTDGLQVKTHRGTQKTNLCFSDALPFTLTRLWNVLVSDALSQSL